jgi:NodT family efflux transporter outer membrane factor (OMF) lipoprotein
MPLRPTFHKRSRRSSRALARGLRLCAATLLLPLWACTALGPPGADGATIEVPARWAAGGGVAPGGVESLSDWWLRFDDAQIGALVALALQANPGILGSQAALRQAQALRDGAAAALWPQLGSSASVQTGMAGGHRSGSNYSAGLNANWAPDVFGATRAAVAAADAQVQASAASLGDTQVQIAAETALDVILLRAAQARLRIAGDNLASQEETLQITLWRQQAGLVTALEAEQARAAVAQTRAQLPGLQTGIQQALHALAVLTGRPPAALQLDTLPPQADAPQARDGWVLDTPAETLRQRPDVRASEYAVQAARARVGQAQALRWPGFSLGGSLGVSALTLGALSGSAALVGSLAAGVSLPLFDGGAARAQVRAQQAALEQAGQVWRAAVLGALKDVEDALVALRGDRLRLQSLRQAAVAAASAGQLARQRYSSGLVDFQTVLETQRTQLSTQDSVAAASADVGSDQVRLFKALGGGWRIEAGATTLGAAAP